MTDAAHVLDTQRLLLRRLEPADDGFIFEITNDPDWLRHIGDRGIRSLDDARRYITDGPCAMYERHGFGLYLVGLRLERMVLPPNETSPLCLYATQPSG